MFYLFLFYIFAFVIIEWRENHFCVRIDIKYDKAVVYNIR